MPSTPALPTSLEILFHKDKPPTTAAGEKGLSDSLTTSGRASLRELVAELRNNPDLKVQLVGRTSPEHSEAYNIALGQRRAELIAQALASKSIDPHRIADPPLAELRSECQHIRPGVVTCGEAGSTGPKDRVVLARIFPANP
jgi:hypothetical protein